MVSVVNALLLGGWLIFSYFLLGTVRRPLLSAGNRLLRHGLRLDDELRELKELWEKQDKGIFIVRLLAILIIFVLAILFDNYLILLCGGPGFFYLPIFLVRRKRRKERFQILKKLTDPLRMIVSRLPDLQNITRAVEITRDEIHDDQVKELFNLYIQEVSLGSSTRDALDILKYRVKLKKFEIFIDTLIQAHYEGFTAQALKALDKALEAMEFDLRAIDIVREKNRNNKKKLYTAVLLSWLFPPLLSLVNMGEVNIYTSTWTGRVLVFLYIISSMYVFYKGEEYLSLNLDEL